MKQKEQTSDLSRNTYWKNVSKILKHYPLALILYTNILTFSSALKASSNDYSLAGEIAKNINLQTWWTVNLPIAMFLAFFLLSPTLLHPALLYINKLISDDTKGKLDKIKENTPTWVKRRIPNFIKRITPNQFKVLILLSIQATFLIAISAYIDFALGFHSFFTLGLVSTIVFLALSFLVYIIFAFFSTQKEETLGESDRVLNKATAALSLILLLLHPTFTQNSFHVGQSCLIQTIDNSSQAVGTIIPLDFSKDNLKAIWIEEGKSGYIRNTAIDISYSIYPDSCERLNNEKSEPDSFRPTFNLNKQSIY